jgi:hypothetical protein
MTRLPLAFALLAALVLAPAADAKSNKRCAVRGASEVAKNSRAVVLTRTVADGLGDSTELWGCLRQRRRPVFIGSVGFSQYASSTIDAVRLRGSFVAYSHSSTVVDGSCSAGLTVYSLVRERPKYGWGTESQHESLGCSSVTALVLNDHGRAAFFEGVSSGQAAVHKLDTTGLHQLDFGAVDALAISATAVSWTNAGETRTHQLY